jgi:hypothetical protein
MSNILGASWLTTAIGILAALLNILQDIQHTGSISMQTLINATSFLTMGAAAKSFNVSGAPGPQGPQGAQGGESQ